MPRKKRITKGNFVYHVINRANGKLRIFKKDLDFIAFENILAEGLERFDMRMCGYCIMSNHWHLLLWPVGDGDLTNFMRWITLTHTQRWHAAHGTTGTGHVYQGPFKSFPVQKNQRYLKTMQYIEANPLAACMVQSVADWPWSSYSHRCFEVGTVKNEKPFSLDPGPMQLPENWPEIVNRKLKEEETAELARCIRKGTPYGDKEWTIKTAEKLNLQSTLREKGRPGKFKWKT
ncbi:MAG: transposase [Phycisphaerae bacterium]|nr:transposase [Phycisphaerae bacterium]